MGRAKDNSPPKSADEHRLHAEDHTSTKTAERHPARTDTDAPRLLQELQVHQVELEMQNEELRRIREELELSRNKYTELYDFAPVGYFTLDKSGLIRETNLAAAQMLGIERSQLTNRPFIGFIADVEGRDRSEERRVGKEC